MKAGRLFLRQAGMFTSPRIKAAKPKSITWIQKGKMVQFTHTPGQYESWSPVPAADGYVYFTSDQSGKAEVYYLDSEGKTGPVHPYPGPV